MASFSDRISVPFLGIFYWFITYDCSDLGNKMILSVSIVLFFSKQFDSNIYINIIYLSVYILLTFYRTYTTK